MDIPAEVTAGLQLSNYWQQSTPVSAGLSRGSRSEGDEKIVRFLVCCHENYSRSHNSICKVSQKVELFPAT